MALLSFAGNLVAATNSHNDDGSGGTDISLDQDQDLDGNGNPWYAATDIIWIEIADEDIDADGELQAAGADGEVTVTSFKVNGVEQLTGDDKIKFDSNGLTEMGDGFFYIEGLQLTVLSQDLGLTFEDAVDDNGDLVLNVPSIVEDYDLNDNGQVDSGTAEVGDGLFNINTSMVVCFTRGTLIRTPLGDMPVETLHEGDLVRTLDNGDRPVRLVVHRRLDFATADPGLKPIEFKPGSLGPGLPRRPLCVSPQHRMLIKAGGQGSDTDDSGQLLAAKGLTHHPGIRSKKGCKSVDYYHLVFDRHEVVFSEGVASESFYPGPVAVGTLDEAAAREVSFVFPQLAGCKRPVVEAARHLVRPGQAKRLYPRRCRIAAVPCDMRGPHAYAAPIPDAGRVLH